VELRDENAIPAYVKVSEKVLHLRRLGMTYTGIAERFGINPWMAKKAARWGNIQKALAGQPGQARTGLTHVSIRKIM
jgi:hypothetical protein